MNHVGALDGIRFLAAFIVVGVHSRLLVMDGGFIGVDVFFVLSGFLMGSILIPRRNGIELSDIAQFIT